MFERELESKIWGVYEDRQEALDRYVEDVTAELMQWDDAELESAWNGDDEYEGYLQDNIRYELDDEYSEIEIKEALEKVADALCI